jgi:hypothetical protein
MLFEGKSSGFVLRPGVFDNHVLELAGLEDVAALEAFDKFGIFLARYNLDTWVLALIHGASLLGGLRRRD